MGILDTGLVAALSCGWAWLTPSLFPFPENADWLSRPGRNGKYYSCGHISSRHTLGWELSWHVKWAVVNREREREGEREVLSHSKLSGQPSRGRRYPRGMMHEIHTETHKYLIARLHITSIRPLRLDVFKRWAEWRWLNKMMQSGWGRGGGAAVDCWEWRNYVTCLEINLKYGSKCRSQRLNWRYTRNYRARRVHWVGDTSCLSITV